MDRIRLYIITGLLKISGLKQKEFAELNDISKQAMSDYLRSRTISLNKLNKMAKKINVAVDVTTETKTHKVIITIVMQKHNITT